MTQVTLRNVPDEVRHKLKVLARQRGKSMNSLTVELLEESLGFKPPTQRQRDLTDVFVTWSTDQAREFEKHTMMFEQIDEELWT